MSGQLLNRHDCPTEKFDHSTSTVLAMWIHWVLGNPRFNILTIKALAVKNKSSDIVYHGVRFMLTFVKSSLPWQLIYNLMHINIIWQWHTLYLTIMYTYMHYLISNNARYYPAHVIMNQKPQHTMYHTCIQLVILKHNLDMLI